MKIFSQICRIEKKDSASRKLTEAPKFKSLIEIQSTVRTNLNTKFINLTTEHYAGEFGLWITLQTKLIEIIKDMRWRTCPMFVHIVSISNANVTRADLYLNWTPKVPIEVGMKRFMDWFIANNASKYML